MTSDTIIYSATFGLIYLALAAVTAFVIFTQTVSQNPDLTDTQRKITLARAVLASLVWPVFWVLAMGFFLYRGVRFVLRYGFRSMDTKPKPESQLRTTGWSPVPLPNEAEKEQQAIDHAREQMKMFYPQEHVDWINDRFEERK